MTTSAIDRINQVQRRILAGEDVTASEMNEAIQQLRSERGSASTSHREAKAKKEPPQIDLLALLNKKIEKEA